jgi:hypothetical protein
MNYLYQIQLLEFILILFYFYSYLLNIYKIIYVLYLIENFNIFYIYLERFIKILLYYLYKLIYSIYLIVKLIIYFDSWYFSQIYLKIYQIFLQNKIF